MKSKFSNSLVLETARVSISVVDKTELERIFENQGPAQFSDSAIYFLIANTDDKSSAGWMAIEETANGIDIKRILILENFRGGRVFRETLFALLNFCLNVLKVEKVYALIPVANEPAKAAFLKAAFIPDSVRTKQPVSGDTEEFSLALKEWPLRGIQFFNDIL